VKKKGGILPQSYQSFPCPLKRKSWKRTGTTNMNNEEYEAHQAKVEIYKQYYYDYQYYLLNYLAKMFYDF
jgi:hypothetical protein